METSRKHPFSKSMRIKHGSDFSRVYQFRARVFSARIAVCCRPTGEEKPARLGLSVSKKVGGATVRNLWKRRLREAFRLRYDSIPHGYDYVVVPQRGLKETPSYAELASDLVDLAKRAAKKARRFAEAKAATSEPAVQKNAETQET